MYYNELTNINITMNKYNKWYDQIINNGLTEKLPGYERHHILPKSLGGNNKKDNLVYITAREHFICHWLLTKIYPTGEEHWKMLNALRIMRAENKNQQRYDTKITSRVYAKLKEEYSQLQSERMRGQKNPMFGKIPSDAVRQGRSERATYNNSAKLPGVGTKISEAKKGVKREIFSDEWRAKMSASKLGTNNNRYGVEVLEETREKIRQKAIGRKQSPETIAKKAEAVRGSKREKKLCIHCNKEVAVNGYARWHGDNCKAL